MKKTLLLLIINFYSCRIFSQEGQAIAKATSIGTTENGASSIKSDSQKLNKNLLPLFGEIKKSDQEVANDNSFIEMCKKNFPNLTEASKFFADRGWEYLAESELDTAMHRFNLCYLLNEKNMDAYWGIGVICFQKGELDKASTILKKGIEIDSTNSSLIVDLATVEITCYEKTNHYEDLILAHDYLAKAIDIDPSNVSAWTKRSETEYYLENYENAWECVHSARLLDISKIDLGFVEKLNLKMKDPKEVFKF